MCVCYANQVQIMIQISNSTLSSLVLKHFQKQKVQKLDQCWSLESIALFSPVPSGNFLFWTDCLIEQ